MKMHRTAFTLVELLVVIAIIGILVALLLPAVQSARESARRTQCRNKLKQIGLAIFNHENALGEFPTGGTKPWPSIEDHARAGSPNSGTWQGLGWAFQILPYLEEGAVYGIDTTAEIEQTAVEIFNCPSRRGLTRSTLGTYITDYAAATPGKETYDPTRPATVNEGDFWGWRHDDACRRGDCIWRVVRDGEYYGVMVRSQVDLTQNPVALTSSTDPTRMGKITDGTSNTLMVGEKRLQPSRYQIGDWHDDRGWSDGWDPDNMRATYFPLRKDQDVHLDPERLGGRRFGFCFGSAHNFGIHGVFADGSVRAINYDVDPVLFNAIGHRSDGAALDLSSLQ